MKTNEITDKLDEEKTIILAGIDTTNKNIYCAFFHNDFINTLLFFDRDPYEVGYHIAHRMYSGVKLAAVSYDLPSEFPKLINAEYDGKIPRKVSMLRPLNNKELQEVQIGLQYNYTPKDI